VHSIDEILRGERNMEARSQLSCGARARTTTKAVRSGRMATRQAASSGIVTAKEPNQAPIL
jgi:hypothetical protein